VQVFDVSAITVHPGYDADAIVNDVALLQLDAAAVFTDAVQPLKVASVSPTPGDKAVTTGWGHTTGGGPASDALRQAILPIESALECGDHFSDLWGSPGFTLDRTMLCAGVASGEVGICNGDSGGPLVVPKADGSSGWELVGISSWVSGSPVLCGSYSVYTRVSEFAGWIAGIAGPTPLLGDVDGSGCVDQADVDAVVSAYGAAPPTSAHDTNSDGVVNYLDYLNVLASWGSCL
jgi:secreted trypsin-like serine protease